MAAGVASTSDLHARGYRGPALRDARVLDVAYSYAWWLTGDPPRATAAVRSALAAGPHDDLADLLAAIRVEAGGQCMMCPASEVALLHDSHGLPLDVAAGLAEVNPADALGELAHGRLEALRQTITEPFKHPERLGGLAVGNPPDVAHARQCPNCAHALALLREGRTELQSLSAPPPPASLYTVVEPGDVTGEEAAATQALSHLPSSGEHGPPRPARGRRAFGAVVAFTVVVTGGLSWQPRTSPAAPETSREESPNTSPTETEPSASPAAVLLARTEDLPEPPPPLDGLRVTAARLMLPNGQPTSMLLPTEPIRLAVDYEGAAGGIGMTARWLVNGHPFTDLTVALAGPHSTHVFGAAPPPEGWPPGTHQLVVTVAGAVVATVAFTVAG